MIQEKVFNNLQLLGMRCPQFRFPIWIIIFDELELILYVSQGLTLSTASLVFIKLYLMFGRRSMSIAVNLHPTNSCSLEILREKGRQEGKHRPLHLFSVLRDPIFQISGWISRLTVNVHIFSSVSWWISHQDSIITECSGDIIYV